MNDQPTPPQPPQDPYGQQPYGQQPQGQPPYGQNPYGAAPPPPAGQYGHPGQPHPKATTILVLGILSLVVCSLLGPVAWIMGNNAISEVENSQGYYSEEGGLKVGRILGIIGTALLGVGILAMIFLFGTVGLGVMAGLEDW